MSFLKRTRRILIWLSRTPFAAGASSDPMWTARRVSARDRDRRSAPGRRARSCRDSPATHTDCINGDGRGDGQPVRRIQYITTAHTIAVRGEQWMLENQPFRAMLTSTVGAKSLIKLSYLTWEWIMQIWVRLGNQNLYLVLLSYTITQYLKMS